MMARMETDLKPYWLDNSLIQSINYYPLVHPYWNHWPWSLQSDCLSTVWFVKVSHYFFLLNAFLSPANENGVWIKSWYWLKSILYSGLWFQNGCNKVTTDLLVRQFWFKTIPVIWNLTRAKCLFEVEITQMISDQTAFHSVNCHYLFNKKHTII